LVGGNLIKNEWSKINAGFDAVQSEMDGKVSKSGGELTGDFIFENGKGVYGKDTIGTPQLIAAVTTQVLLGDADLPVNLRGTTVSINGNIAWHTGNNSASLVSAGYQRLASGLIIQWGTTPGINPGTTGEALFPIVFPNACLSVVATVESWPEVAAVVVNTVSTNVFGVNHNAPSARSIRFIAVGY